VVQPDLSAINAQSVCRATKLAEARNLLITHQIKKVLNAD
jgi:hypothetical protein